MTQTRLEALADILAKAENLKMYRENGATYFKKCDDLVVRIKCILRDVNIADLDPFEIKKISHIRKLISEEETFARSSSDVRDSSKWFSELND